jgi:hypothetical protein
MRRAVILLSVLSVLALAALEGGARRAVAISSTRQADPVVLTGANISTLTGIGPGKVVGFRWTGTGWTQVPIQIDERAVVNFSKIYHNPSAVFYGSQVSLVSALVYTSTNTWTGADPDPKFDSNDELAFMARDAGTATPSGTPQPAQTVPGTGVEVHVTDPLAPGTDAFVYLFRKIDGSTLVPGAHKKYVAYTFKLSSGGYKKTYSLTGSANPENSTVVGKSYKRHFSDRWLTDQLSVTAAGSSAVDVLDRNKVLFAPGTCVRSEDTFDASGPNGTAEGAFIANKSGPVRAIRSYIGANSGPSTQRTHIFYDRREDVRTDLRVHQIPSVMDFVDYSPAATGMTYRNELNPTGVTIDGTPDATTAGNNGWEQVTGAQGSITNVASMHASFTPSVTSYYEDNATNPTTQCTGDAYAYGSSGSYINATIPCTDPGHGCSATFDATRTTYYDGPGGTAETAQIYDDDVNQPLQASTAPWP